MTRSEHLEFCKICTKHKKDLNVGILCGLTGEIADFETECSSFEEDVERKKPTYSSNWSTHVELNTASQSKRFANFIIDRLFLYGFATVFGVALGLVLVYFFPEYLDILEEDNIFFEYLLGFILGVIYYSFFEGFTGRSMGKFFTKTKVVTEDGEKPDFGTIVVRSMCRYIPFNAISFLSSEEAGWHDRFSKTRVVEID